MTRSMSNKWNATSTKRYKIVNETRVDEDTKGMLDMLKISSHEDVVKEVLKYMDKEKYTVYSDKLWTMIIPNSDDKLFVGISAHTDTVRNVHPTTFAYTDATKTEVCNMEDDLIGGDDRLGCWLIQQLLKDGRQDFIFTLFDQEEVGGVGSSAFVKHKDFEILKEKASCFIGLDRKGYNEMASYGFESEEFVEILENIEGWNTDFGSFTDIATLAEEASISCVNFSVGYYNEHGANEYIRPNDCKNTLQVIRNLPKILWTKQFECDSSPYGYGYGRGYGWNDNYNYSSYKYDDDYDIRNHKYDEDNTCDCCGEFLYSPSEQAMGVCRQCLEADEETYKDTSCLYCDNPYSVYINKQGDNICMDCMVAYCLTNNKDYCAFLVTKIMENLDITEADSMETYSKMREVNLISYYSLFEVLKLDQIVKVDEICKKYSLPPYHL